MIKGVISAPRGVISGMFNIHISFRETVLFFSEENIRVEAVSGAALGHPYDEFSGQDRVYQLLCYPPENAVGESRISIIGEAEVVRGGRWVSEPLSVAPIIVAYDTVRTVDATWGIPVEQGKRKLRIPISFDMPIRNLKKRHFSFSYATPFQLYGSDDSYSLVIPKAQSLFTVFVEGLVEKTNGIQAEIQRTPLEVEKEVR